MYRPGHCSFRTMDHRRLPRAIKLSLGVTTTLASMLVVDHAAQAQGVPNPWAGGVSTDVTNPANWSAGSPNTGNASITINGGSPYSALWTINGAVADPVNWSNPAGWSAQSFVVGDGSVAGGPGLLTINGDPTTGATGSPGQGYVETAGSGMVVGANGGTGTITLNLRPDHSAPGTVFSPYSSSTTAFSVGTGQGSSGTLNVLGYGKNVQSQNYGSGNDTPGSLQATGALQVGAPGGTGLVNIEDGGVALNFGAGPMLSVGTGAGSHGAVNVLSGGKLAVNLASGSGAMPSVIGSDQGTGALTVSGFNAGGYASSANFGSGLQVGTGGGNGSVNVLAGGKAMSFYMFGAPSTTLPIVSAQVGTQGGTGNIVVDGAGSIWYVAGITSPFGNPDDGTQIGNLQLGSDGVGNITLSNGGVLTLGTANISQHSQDAPVSANWFQLDSFDNGLGTLFMGSTPSGNGTLNIGAAAGQAAVAPGTLEAAQIELGPGAASVVFNHTASDYVFSVPLVGSGTLSSYSGITFIDKPPAPPAGAAIDNSAFSGSTNLYGGTLGLRYDQALGSSDVHVLGSGGGLIYGSGTAISNTIDIASGATLTASNENGSSATQNGVISGSGMLLKSGPGTLTLTAVNTLTGETDIEGGTLALVNGGSLEASSRVLDNSVFDVSGVDSIANIITLAGSGSANVGAKTLNLTGAHDTFDGVFTGSGALTLTAGNEVLTGNSNGYSGTTSINGGSLWVNGTLGSSAATLTANSGGRLGGNGTVGGNATIADGGFITPGTGPQQAGLLHVGGDLTLGNAATLEYDFGQANVPGGDINDLIDVNGNLTLGGTINITETPGGRFELGIYRVINYDGSLIDNGLAIGTVSVSGLEVQTAVPHQVNLIYLPPSPITLNIWDGDLGPKNNGVIDGGNGVWQASAGNNSWTNIAGTPNAPWTDGGFAIFTSAPGTVNVDNSLGPVTAFGMQFASDGYLVQGDTLTLTGEHALIRVGEGLSRSLGVPLLTATIMAPIAGSAELIKADTGTLVLGGINTYSGGTFVEGGTLKISSDANLGDASGALSLGGGTLENSASLQSARHVTVFDSGELATDSGTQLTLSGAVDGSGTLVKSGAGTLALLGDGNFAGQALVTAGTLSVDGSLPGAQTTMTNGTLLVGNGTLGSTTLQTGATIAPGHSIGTFTVQGNYQQEAGAVYQVQLDPGSAQSDLIHVTGGATLAPGAALKVSRNTNQPYANLTTRYTVLSADGGLTGTFALGGDTAVSTFANLIDTYDANHAYLGIEQTRPIDDAGVTPNEIATGGGIDSLPDDSPIKNEVIIDSVTDADARYALNQLSGEAYASMRGIFLEDSRFIREAVSYRMRGDAHRDGAADHQNDADTFLWGHVFGSWANNHSHDTTYSLDRDIGGFFMGGDREISGAWRLGAVGGYSHTNFNVDDLNSSGSSDDYHLGLYAGNDEGKVQFHGGLAYSWHDVTMKRTPALYGTHIGLSSDFTAGTAQAWTEIAYDMPGRDADLQPFFNAAYVQLHTDGFQEKGDAATALYGSGQQQSTTFSTLGARLIAPLHFSDHASLELRASAGWRHAYGQLTPTALLQFAGGAPFGVIGTALDRDALAVDIGVGGKLAPSVDMGVTYSGVMGANSSDNGFKAYVQWQF